MSKRMLSAPLIAGLIIVGSFLGGADAQDCDCSCSGALNVVGGATALLTCASGGPVVGALCALGTTLALAGDFVGFLGCNAFTPQCVDRCFCERSCRRSRQEVVPCDSAADAREGLGLCFETVRVSDEERAKCLEDCKQNTRIELRCEGGLELVVLDDGTQVCAWCGLDKNVDTCCLANDKAQQALCPTVREFTGDVCRPTEDGRGVNDCGRYCGLGPQPTIDLPGCNVPRTSRCDDGRELVETSFGTVCADCVGNNPRGLCEGCLPGRQIDECKEVAANTQNRCQTC